MLESLVFDLRLAARALWRTPGFTTAAVVTLALDVGATTAVFSIVYGVLLRPLPFPTADRLVQVVQILPARAGGEPTRAGVTPDQIAEWRATSRTFGAARRLRSSVRLPDGHPRPCAPERVTVVVPLFRALGAAPIRGRLFETADEQAGDEQVVVNPAIHLPQELETPVFAAPTYVLRGAGSGGLSPAIRAARRASNPMPWSSTT